MVQISVDVVGRQEKALPPLMEAPLGFLFVPSQLRE
jgi:hypothetical protein